MVGIDKVVYQGKMQVQKHKFKKSHLSYHKESMLLSINKKNKVEITFIENSGILHKRDREGRTRPELLIVQLEAKVCENLALTKCKTVLVLEERK